MFMLLCVCNMFLVGASAAKIACNNEDGTCGLTHSNPYRTDDTGLTPVKQDSGHEGFTPMIGVFMGMMLWCAFVGLRPPCIKLPAICFRICQACATLHDAGVRLFAPKSLHESTNANEMPSEPPCLAHRAEASYATCLSRAIASMCHPATLSRRLKFWVWPTRPRRIIGVARTVAGARMPAPRSCWKHWWHVHLRERSKPDRVSSASHKIRRTFVQSQEALRGLTRAVTALGKRVVEHIHGLCQTLTRIVPLGIASSVLHMCMSNCQAEPLPTQKCPAATAGAGQRPPGLNQILRGGGGRGAAKNNCPKAPGN